MKAPLPLRDGVAPSYLWLPPAAWPDMLTFLLDRFPDVGEAVWRSRMQRGEGLSQGLRFRAVTAVRPRTA